MYTEIRSLTVSHADFFETQTECILGQSPWCWTAPGTESSCGFGVTYGTSVLQNLPYFSSI